MNTPRSVLKKKTAGPQDGKHVRFTDPITAEKSPDVPKKVAPARVAVKKTADQSAQPVVPAKKTKMADDSADMSMLRFEQDAMQEDFHDVEKKLLKQSEAVRQCGKDVVGYIDAISNISAERQAFQNDIAEIEKCYESADSAKQKLIALQYEHLAHIENVAKSQSAINANITELLNYCSKSVISGDKDASSSDEIDYILNTICNIDIDYGHILNEIQKIEETIK